MLFGRAAASPKTHSDSLLVLLRCVLKYLGPVLLTESRNLNRLLSVRIVKYEAMEAKIVTHIRNGRTLLYLWGKGTEIYTMKSQDGTR